MSMPQSARGSAVLDLRLEIANFSKAHLNCPFAAG